MNLRNPCPRCKEPVHRNAMRQHREKCGVTPAELFWSKVDKSSGSNGCWRWTAYRTPDGYGEVVFQLRHMQSHRAAWTFTNGEIPSGMHVLHRCDNRACCNPEHLFLGSNTDNVLDKLAKKGSQICITRNTLTDADVRQIRRDYRQDGAGRKAPNNSRELAARYGVGRGSIHAVVSGRRWKHVK